MFLPPAAPLLRIEEGTISGAAANGSLAGALVAPPTVGHCVRTATPGRAAGDPPPAPLNRTWLRRPAHRRGRFRTARLRRDRTRQPLPFQVRTLAQGERSTVVEGLLNHHWHGKDRRYISRWWVLRETQFDPTYDLKRDLHLIWQLTDRSEALRDGLRRVAHSRNEDSIDL